jgi:hypothetical protein
VINSQMLSGPESRLIPGLIGSGGSGSGGRI